MQDTGVDGAWAGSKWAYAAMLLVGVVLISFVKVAFKTNLIITKLKEKKG